MYQEFLDFLQHNNQRIFIDVEGKQDKIQNFITKYNSSYAENVAIGDDGICLLSNTVDKWSIELRIYFNDTTGIPVYWNGRKYRNHNYRSDEFDYRLDDNKLMWFLFDSGYRLGYN
ncbi:MAG: hypothetical protein PHE51_11470 [Eubacteriales bacterium]|jgi:hypothetical protein|nr:hypothetical protein [Eubacteriales bacterium]